MRESERVRPRESGRESQAERVRLHLKFLRGFLNREGGASLYLYLSQPDSLIAQSESVS